MTDEQIIEMAREANLPSCLATHPKALKRFSELVAAHTLMNIDPSKFIGGYREGFEAGVAKEREACAKIAWNREPDDNGPIETAIRARGKA